MSSLFGWLESTAFSVWVRESPSMFAFPAILTCHTIGMGVAAGINTALALRILGVGPGRLGMLTGAYNERADIDVPLHAPRCMG